MVSEFPPLKTIPSMLKYWSEHDPERPAFIFAEKERSVSYSRRVIFELAGKMASKLRKIGLRKGDVVSIIMTDRANCPDWLIAEYGIQMAGCVSLDALGDLKSGEDTIIPLQISKSKAIIVDLNFSLFNEMFNGYFSKSTPTPYGEKVVCHKLPALKYLIHTSNASGKKLEDQLRSEDDIFMEEVTPDNRATLMSTSGTTSLRKLVPFTHKLKFEFGKQLTDIISGTRFYNDRSFGWLAGYPIAYVYSGITRILRNKTKKNLPSEVEVLAREESTCTVMTPKQVHDIAEELKKDGARQLMLQGVILVAQPIRKSAVDETKSFAKKAVHVYASTETAAMSLLTVEATEPFEDYCAGYAVPGNELKIVDTNDKEVKNGERGEILFKGPSLFEGYLSEAGLVKSKLTEDGWFNTGDIGYFDAEGKLFAEGRGSDAIMHGDAFVFPHHIEDIIRQCPFVEDVVVVAIPDELLHQIMCACIIIKGTANLETVKESIYAMFIQLPNQMCFERPEHILQFESFPCNRNGKVKRRELVQSVKAQFDL